MDDGRIPNARRFQYATTPASLDTPAPTRTPPIHAPQLQAPGNPLARRPPPAAAHPPPRMAAMPQPPQAAPGYPTALPGAAGASLSAHAYATPGGMHPVVAAPYGGTLAPPMAFAPDLSDPTAPQFAAGSGLPPLLFDPPGAPPSFASALPSFAPTGGFVPAMPIHAGHPQPPDMSANAPPSGPVRPKTPGGFRWKGEVKTAVGKLVAAKVPSMAIRDQLWPKYGLTLAQVESIRSDLNRSKSRTAAMPQPPHAAPGYPMALPGAAGDAPSAHAHAAPGSTPPVVAAPYGGTLAPPMTIAPALPDPAAQQFAADSGLPPPLFDPSGAPPSFATAFPSFAPMGGFVPALPIHAGHPQPPDMSANAAPSGPVRPRTPGGPMALPGAAGASLSASAFALPDTPPLPWDASLGYSMALPGAAGEAPSAHAHAAPGGMPPVVAASYGGNLAPPMTIAPALPDPTAQQFAADSGLPPSLFDPSGARPSFATAFPSFAPMGGVTPALPSYAGHPRPPGMISNLPPSGPLRPKTPGGFHWTDDIKDRVKDLTEIGISNEAIAEYLSPLYSVSPADVGAIKRSPPSREQPHQPNHPAKVKGKWPPDILAAVAANPDVNRDDLSRTIGRGVTPQDVTSIRDALRHKDRYWRRKAQNRRQAAQDAGMAALTAPSTPGLPASARPAARPAAGLPTASTLPPPAAVIPPEMPMIGSRADAVARGWRAGERFYMIGKDGQPVFGKVIVARKANDPFVAGHFKVDERSATAPSAPSSGAGAAAGAQPAVRERPISPARPPELDASAVIPDGTAYVRDDSDFMQRDWSFRSRFYTIRDGQPAFWMVTCDRHAGDPFHPSHVIADPRGG